jgi:hypothetical protein
MTAIQYAIARTAAQLQEAKTVRDLTPDETRALAVCSKLTAQYARPSPSLQKSLYPARFSLAKCEGFNYNEYRSNPSIRRSKMANKYPGYCTDCGREVRAGHGDLVKRGGKWVVSCGGSKAAVAPKVEKPKVVAPEGMRLTDLHISSSNAALNVSFRLNGLGRASSFAPFQYGTAIKYTRWTGVLREGRPDEAAAHDAICEANEALHADLQAQGQIAYDSEQHEFSFPLSATEQAALSGLIESAKSGMVSAILDGTAEVRVGEVGCDFPHDQILGIKVAGESLEYALIQNVLGSLNLKVDGGKECKDLAAAIRERQQAQIERARKVAEHKERRAQGYHVVLMRRCWECGRTQILGELDDEMREVRMSAEVYAECVRDQKQAHARSLATVPEGTILSSVGFDPAPESKFDFRVVESDWYCGC